MLITWKDLLDIDKNVVAPKANDLYNGKNRRLL